VANRHEPITLDADEDEDEDEVDVGEYCEDGVLDDEPEFIQVNQIHQKNYQHHIEVFHLVTNSYPFFSHKQNNNLDQTNKPITHQISNFKP
jgi:hypothetical protein